MKITKNILVNIHYRLTDEENNHLNPEDDELIYLHGGYGHIFEDFEKALEGKKVGENFKVTLSPQRAFGLYREDLVVREPIDELPEDIFTGMELDGMDEVSNETLIYTVTDMEDDFAILNANHPFAGRTITFEGTVVELQSLSDEEVAVLLAHEEEHHCHHDK
jgi:FKBP-type peptidyl-prolyl cis-trans isomerase SlyD